MGKEKFFKLKNSLFISYRFSNKLLTLFTDRFDLIIYWRKIMTFRTLVLSKLVAIQNNIYLHLFLTSSIKNPLNLNILPLSNFDCLTIFQCK